MTLMVMLGGVNTGMYRQWRERESNKYRSQYPELIDKAREEKVISFHPGLIHAPIQAFL